MFDLIRHYLTQNALELTGALLTLVCVWLNTQANSWGWGVGIAATCCYTWVAFQGKIWGFCVLNVFFALLSAYGWWHWLFYQSTTDPIKQTLPITSLPFQSLSLFVAIGFLGTVGIGLFLQWAGGASPWLDAPIFAFSLVAQYLLTQKKVENWLFWIGINALTVVLFVYLQYWVSAVLYALLFLLAMKGYADWRKIMEIKK